MLTALDDPTPYAGLGIVCIPLTKGQVAMVDEADYHLVAGFRWHAIRSSNGRIWYAQTSFRSCGRYAVTMHQLIVPGVPLLDHKDRNGLNNRRGNLRPANESLNGYNTAKQDGSLSRYKGVRFRSSRPKKPWLATIGRDSTFRFLGCFFTEE